MLRISHHEIDHPFIEKAVTKLEKCENFVYPTSYRVMRYCEAVRKELQIQRKTFLACLKKYGVLDEKGEPIYVPETRGFKIKDGLDEAFDQEFKAWKQATVFEVKVHKVLLSDIEKAYLAPGELSAIEHFISFPEYQDSEPEASKAETAEEKK